VPAAEQALVGGPLDDARIAEATRLLLHGAQGMGHNDFKIELARRAIARALSNANAAAETATG
jgi:xanthine dehydrogenase YagS FAD-binding subunit